MWWRFYDLTVSPSTWKYRYRRVIKWPFQRAIRGYSDCDAWNMDHYIAYLIPRMIKHLQSGFPAVFEDDGIEWEEIKSKIAEGFEIYRKYEECELDNPWMTKEERAKFDEAMALFAKWFGSLWD